jgi:putative membrane protein
MLMNMLIKHAYTGTFSTIFGLFLAVIPTVVMQESCAITSVPKGFEAVGYAVVGVLVSLYLGDIKGNNARLARLFSKKNR